MICFLTMPRWHDVLLQIYKSPDRERYCEKLNRAVKASRTHIREIVKLLARYNLIEVQPTKKTKRLCLTEKGRKVASFIMEIKAELNH